ncbi:TonB-dependent receptor [Novosphingobium cyanobacteriorum]|uniref:TonB-dependent receptor n=1 Tax=Novosphingobium cyanobacteriorum TaxID=3024215 RepID=A0ABT6CKP8_9SPHN|nr:TonB-dependent receptor [Novosphingobium cyanobacteriorum]MDF8334477.1 TonB-dependent receptor [Novosphingobium cyanobacteriorum]
MKTAFQGAASAIALFAATSAFAQEAPGPDASADQSIAPGAGDGGDGIIVTGSRRRDENVQDIPVAVAVVSAAALERRGDFTLGQIQQQVPSLQVFSFNPRNTNINIRGLGSNVALTNDGLENGVGFYIDNVYYGRVGLSQFDLVDLESIEILRGPQGTLFGKNTTSGVINITSRKPVFDPEFSGEVNVGSYGFYQLRASASAGIVPDRLAVRISGAISGNNGFTYNKTQGIRSQDYYNASIRGQLLFTPNSDLSIRVIGDYSRQTQHSVMNLLVANYANYADGTVLHNARGVADNYDIRVARFPGYVKPDFNAFNRVGEADSHYQANMAGYGISGQVDWDFGGAALTSITAYRWWDWDPANDGDATSLPAVVKAQQANRQRQFSQEVRLASKGSRTIDYVVGAYYFWQTVRGYGATGYGAAAPLWFLGASNPVTNAALNGFEVNSYSEPTTKTIAAFGQTDWQISPTLTLTTGLRFTHEDKTGTFQQWVANAPDISAFPAATQATILGIRSNFNKVVPLYETRLKNDNLSGLVSLGWKVTPDVLVYGTYSRGNKSGGLNLTQLPAGITADVRPEKIDAFEVGLKSQFLDRHVTFNAAGFWTEIRDYQTAITDTDRDSGVSRQYIANIPKVRSRGVEGDLNIAASDRLSFNASASYTDAKYITYSNAPLAPEVNPVTPTGRLVAADLSGQRLPGVPKFAYTLGVDANAPLATLGGREVSGYLHADWAYRSHFNTSSSNSVWAEIPGYGLLNARVGLRTGDGLWDVSVWSRNLLNKDYYLSLSAGTIGLVTGQVGEPRTIGATLRTRF